MGWFSFLKQAASAVPTPSTGKVAIFVDSTSGIPNYKGEDGVAHTLKGDTGGGMTNPMTTAGDLIIGGAAGAPGRLGAGISGYVLTSGGAGTSPAWSAPSALGSPATTLSIASGVVNVDCSLGDYFTLAVTANVTSLTFSNLPASGLGRTIMLRLRQDATGSRTFSLPSSFKAVVGSDTTIQSAANAYTILALTSFDQGTRWEYSMKAGAA